MPKQKQQNDTKRQTASSIIRTLSTSKSKLLSQETQTTNYTKTNFNNSSIGAKIAIFKHILETLNSNLNNLNPQGRKDHLYSQQQIKQQIAIVQKSLKQQYEIIHLKNKNSQIVESTWHIVQNFLKNINGLTNTLINLQLLQNCNSFTESKSKKLQISTSQISLKNLKGCPLYQQKLNIKNVNLNKQIVFQELIVKINRQIIKNQNSQMCASIIVNLMLVMSQYLQYISTNQTISSKKQVNQSINNSNQLNGSDNISNTYQNQFNTQKQEKIFKTEKIVLKQLTNLFQQSADKLQISKIQRIQNTNFQNSIFTYQFSTLPIIVSNSSYVKDIKTITNSMIKLIINIFHKQAIKCKQSQFKKKSITRLRGLLANYIYRFTLSLAQLELDSNNSLLKLCRILYNRSEQQQKILRSSQFNNCHKKLSKCKSLQQDIIFDKQQQKQKTLLKGHHKRNSQKFRSKTLYKYQENKNNKNLDLSSTLRPQFKNKSFQLFLHTKRLESSVLNMKKKKYEQKRINITQVSEMPTRYKQLEHKKLTLLSKNKLSNKIKILDDSKKTQILQQSKCGSSSKMIIIEKSSQSSDIKNLKPYYFKNLQNRFDRKQLIGKVRQQRQKTHQNNYQRKTFIINPEEIYHKNQIKSNQHKIQSDNMSKKQIKFQDQLKKQQVKKVLQSVSDHQSEDHQNSCQLI